MTTSTDRLSTRFNPKAKALILGTTAALGALGVLAGCSSQDSRVFRSTQFQPMSVSLVDQTSSETLWSYDIPVAHQLKVNLDANGDESRFIGYNANNPTRLHYNLQGQNGESGKVDLPGNQLQWVVSIRPAPETVSPGQVVTPEAEESLATPELEGLDLEPLELEPSEVDPVTIEPMDAPDPIDLEPVELEPLPEPAVPDADPIADPALFDGEPVNDAVDAVENALNDAADSGSGGSSILGPGN